MDRIVVGTAGHIDHGKTRLLEALTGIDCDRWAEEKERGITIDLGFAHLEEDGLQIGFVDVPGHENFLHNALAGLGGIRLVLLVVACDEGVEPQTREHLDVCRLLEIPRAIVALTKRDLVGEEMAQLCALEVEELLETTPYAGAPMLEVSSVEGDGVGELRGTLVDTVREIVADDDRQSVTSLPARLPVDRSFRLRGLGAIVTGTLVAGRIEAGQSLDLLPRGESAKVRSVEVHGREREAAEAGERTALQLAGVDLDDLERGEQLVTSGIFASTTRLAARLELLPDAPSAIEGWTPIRFHHFSSEVVGKVRPLNEAGILLPAGLEETQGTPVEIRLAAPVVAVRGDRFVVRRPSPPLTLGGGIVLDPQWKARRGRRILDAVPKLDALDDALRLWVAERGEAGASPAELAARLGRRSKDVAAELQRLASDGRLLRVAAGAEGRFLDPKVVKSVIERGGEILREYFDEHRLAPGMPKAELAGRLLPKDARSGGPADLSDVYLRLLEAEEVAVVEGDLVNPPGRDAAAAMTRQESQLSRDLLAMTEAEGLTPPSAKELASRLGAKAQIVEGVQSYLVDQGKLLRLPQGLIVSSAAIERLADELRNGDLDDFRVTDFKQRFKLSRKWAIPILEHLDSVGVTRRIGDERQVIRPTQT